MAQVIKAATALNDETNPITVSKKNVNISVSGTFTATVQLLRSFNKGSLWRVVASYTVSTETTFFEAERGTWYKLKVSAYTSGTANLRLGVSF